MTPHAIRILAQYPGVSWQVRAVADGERIQRVEATFPDGIVGTIYGCHNTTLLEQDTHNLVAAWVCGELQ